MTLTAKRARVLITRSDLNKTPADVFVHEIPILVAEFGVGNVEVIEDVAVKDGEIEEGVDGEYARLQRKFRRPNEDSNPTTRAYATAEALARAMGVTDYQSHIGLSPALPESMQYDGEAEAEAPKPARRGRPPKSDTGE
jgi:hypothetical protein